MFGFRDDPLNLLPESLREKIDLSCGGATTWHNPQHRLTETARERIEEYLARDHTSYPQRIKRFFRDLISRLKRAPDARRNRAE